MKSRIFTAVICSGMVFALFPKAVFANSSWNWVTTSPLTLLPLAIIFTLLIETVSVVRFGRVNKAVKAFCIIGLANLLSFLAPGLERAYRFIPTTGKVSLSAAFGKGPYYMVFSGYLLLTVIIELPIVYFLLRNNTSDKKRLAVSIILSNVATTVIVAVLERLICVGRW